MYRLPDREIILASASMSRQTMLRQAGLEVAAIPAGVDEDSLKEAARAEGLNIADTATMLAEMKAVKISTRHPEAFVIGSDQILDLEGDQFSKPESLNEARSHLKALSGKTHQLVTSAVIYRDGERIWHHTESPNVSIRSLDDAAIEAYVTMMGEKCLMTPGVYMIEDLGAQIISKIDGCPYAVLGLPLLQMLDFLRGHGLECDEGRS